MYAIQKFRFCPICGSSDFKTNSEKSLLCQACGFEHFLNPSSANVALIYDAQGRLLVERRKNEPARGTLDLPGGFADMHETAEEGVVREVLEETGLQVMRTQYLFSLPNTYRFSGVDIPTLDLFFRCEVADASVLHAADDAAECLWLSPEDIKPEEFGLKSIRSGIEKLLGK